MQRLKVMFQQLLERLPNRNVHVLPNGDKAGGVSLVRSGSERLLREERHVRMEEFIDENSKEYLADYQGNRQPNRNQADYKIRANIRHSMKVSQFMQSAARLNEAFSVVRRVPMIGPLPPAPGVTPWPVMNLI